MQKIVSLILINTLLTGCFSHVLNVEKINASNIVTLNGKNVAMPKAGCYLDKEHGRICTGTKYEANSDLQWIAIGNIDNSATPEITYKDAVKQIPDNETHYAETIGTVLGTVALFALVFAGAYYGGKASANTSSPQYFNNTNDCESDYECPRGLKCIKAPLNSVGKCMAVVNEFGMRNLSPPDPNSRITNTSLSGSCSFSSDCPHGFRCDAYYKQCIKN